MNAPQKDYRQRTDSFRPGDRRAPPGGLAVKRNTNFRQIVFVLRWATLMLGAALGSVNGWTELELWTGGILLANTLFRSKFPIEHTDRDLPILAAVLGELFIGVAAVLATGYWTSPYFFYLSTAVVVAGFSRGFGFSLRVATVTVAIVSISYHVNVEGAVFAETVSWSMELLMVAVLAGYANRIFGEARARETLALSRLGQLAEANDLLLDLHNIARNLPVSLDLEDTFATTLNRIREVLAPHTLVVLFYEKNKWEVAYSEGLLRKERDALNVNGPPPLVTEAFDMHTLQFLNPAHPAPSVSPDAVHGMYAPLSARDRTFGVLVIERHVDEPFNTEDVELVDNLSEYAALAMDNARWFKRLRNLGAKEERARIARELHDQLGQSVAFLSFELERLSEKAKETPLEEELGVLRNDARKIVTELRETLYDLRTETSENEDFATTMNGFVERVHNRSGLTVTTHYDIKKRLPLAQERECWRIAREAVINAEKHAHAKNVSITFISDESGTVLTVTDDGKGFDQNQQKQGSYGLTGMRERADSIGANLEIRSQPDNGTTVTCTLGTP